MEPLALEGHFKPKETPFLFSIMEKSLKAVANLKLKQGKDLTIGVYIF